MPINKIKEFRKDQGITQQQLAESVGTSQQQIQRIESGVQAPRLDLAAQISKALGRSLEDVFPAVVFAVSNFRKKGVSLEKLYQDDGLKSQMEHAGIDMELEIWTLKYQLRNGVTGFFQLAGSVKDRMWSAAQRVGGFDRFIVFDSNDQRVALNLDHLVFCQFLFDPAFPGTPPEESESNTLNVYVIGSSEPLSFEVEPDEAYLSEDPDRESVQLQHLFFILELSEEEHDILHFNDEDGETAFFRANDVAMITAPLFCVEPALMDSI